jgi:hypothetical protein
MKKIMLGLVAAFALAAFTAPVRAEEGAAGTDAAKTDTAKKGKKGKKGKKAEGEAGGEAGAGAGDATKK